MNDFVVENQGSVWLFRATSPEAKAEMESMGLADWQMVGQFSFAVDQRPASVLVGQLFENGFSVGGN